MVRGRARQRERVVMERRSVAVGSKTAGEMLRLAFLCTGGQIRPGWVVLLGCFRWDIRSLRSGVASARRHTVQLAGLSLLLSGCLSLPFGLPRCFRGEAARSIGVVSPAPLKSVGHRIFVGIQRAALSEVSLCLLSVAPKQQNRRGKCSIL